MGARGDRLQARAADVRHLDAWRAPTRHQLGEQIRQPNLVGIAEHEVDAAQRGDLGRARLRPAPGDDDACAWIGPPRAANRLTIGQLCPRRDGACVDHDDVRRRVRLDRAAAPGLQPQLHLVRVDLVQAAAQCYERDCCSG